MNRTSDLLDLLDLLDLPRAGGAGLLIRGLH